jgi:hypothetical protein
MPSWNNEVRKSSNHPHRSALMSAEMVVEDKIGFRLALAMEI